MPSYKVLCYELSYQRIPFYTEKGENGRERERREREKREEKSIVESMYKDIGNNQMRLTQEII